MPAKTTELEAVNTILSSVGEPPINSLTGQQNADATIARNILSEISREVQTQGWHFNTLYDQALSPDSSGYIYLADEVVRVDNTPTTPGSFSSQGGLLGAEDRDVVQRGTRLFRICPSPHVDTLLSVLRGSFRIEWWGHRKPTCTPCKMRCLR